MRSTTHDNDTTIVYDERETQETPKVVSGVTWATVALLALIVILAALLLSGFFSSLIRSPGNGGRQPSTTSSQP